MILLDSGNFTDNPTPTGAVKTRALLEGMDKLGYRTVNVAERDLVLGYDDLMEKAEGLDLRFVSASFVKKDGGEPVFEPYRIEEVRRPGGETLRVGVIGIVRFNPVFLKSGPGQSSIVIARPEDVLRKYLPELRKKADLVVVLGAVHRNDAVRFVRDLEGIDLFLGSYGGYFSQTEEIVGSTRILYTGNQGKRVGDVRLFLEGGRIVAADTYLHFLLAGYPDDPGMAEFVREVHGRLQQRKVERSSAQPSSRWVGSAACRDCHAEAFSQWAGTTHAGAFSTLAKAGKATEDACVSCHLSGAREADGPAVARSRAQDEGVGCESCHGAGATHLASPTRPYGAVGVETCTSCHDLENSPRFDYYTYLPRVVHGARASR